MFVEQVANLFGSLEQISNLFYINLKEKLK